MRFERDLGGAGDGFTTRSTLAFFPGEPMGSTEDRTPAAETGREACNGVRCGGGIDRAGAVGDPGGCRGRLLDPGVAIRAGTGDRMDNPARFSPGEVTCWGCCWSNSPSET